MKTEQELRGIRDIARRSIDPKCQGCQACCDWKFIISITTWILDGDSEFDRLTERAAENLRRLGR